MVKSAGVAVATLSALLATGPGQTPPALKFDAARAWRDLDQLVAIGPRSAGSTGIERARAIITERLAAAGVAVRQQSWNDRTPLGSLRLVNLIATLPGDRPDRLILAGHYDTKRFDGFAFVGANDGGSSAALLLELARVLAGRRRPFTIELLFLDGEEAVVEWRELDRTYGSRHYVEEARRAGELGAIKALILVDMVADRDLEVKRDLNSTPWLTDVIWNAARRLNLGRHFSSASTEIDDDHVPFVRAGVPAVDIIDLDYPAWHTAADTLDAISPASLQVVGDVLLAALPEIERRLAN